MDFRTTPSGNGQVVNVSLRDLLRCMVLTMCVSLLPCAWAQDAPEGPDEGELRLAMQRFFEKRVRAELALTDEQMEYILPRVRRSQEIRAEARRERQRASRELQRGMQHGADDAELQRLLDAMEGEEERRRAAERAVMAEIDSVLSVRQRVQFRFFSLRFGEELQRRIRELEQPSPGRPGRPFRRP